MLSDLTLSTTLFSIGAFHFHLSLLVFIAVGFIAQVIDGALGMAYGVSSNSFLLAAGVPVPVASASVHLAEVATTAVSGISHTKMGNMDKSLFKKLIIPGVIGSIIGAVLLTYGWQNLSAQWETIIKIIVAAYLLAMGIRIVIKAANMLKQKKREFKRLHIIILAALGGLCDAIGGGGWGPIVTSTLVNAEDHPRFVIGTVNTVEFFVTLAQVTVFLALLSIMDWQVIAGLIIGGSIAAPFAAKLCKVIPARTMMFIVGIVIIGLQIYTLIKSALSF